MPVLFVAAAAAAAAAPVPQGVRVAGHVTILEKDSWGGGARDLGDAVVFLEGGAPVSARPGTLSIATRDKSFVPRVAVVPIGATVQFPNLDPFNHNVFSVSEPNQFDLGLYGRGEAARGHTLTTAGLVRVFCNIHPRMVAFISVVATRSFTQPAVDGSFAIEGVPPGRYAMHAWHERSPEVTRAVTVGPAGISDLAIELDARRFRWVAHKNKYGRDYPTNAGRERY